MERISEKFERLTEKFLSGDLDRRIRWLSWFILILLGICLWVLPMLLRYQIPLKDKDTGLSIHLPLRNLIFEKDH